MARIEKSTDNQIANADEDVQKREPLCTTGQNVNWRDHCGKQYGGSSKIKVELPYVPEILLLVIHLKKSKALI